MKTRRFYDLLEMQKITYKNEIRQKTYFQTYSSLK